MFRKASEHILSTERIKGLPFEGSAVTSTVTRGFTNTHTVSLNHISIEYWLCQSLCRQLVHFSIF